MTSFATSMADRIVRLVAPAAPAHAAPVCHDEYSHCQGCNVWQGQLAYDRICNGVFQYTWYRGCGSCAGD